MNVRVGNAGRCGRGVFAECAFMVGALIERCPVIVIPADELEESDTLNNYAFRWSGRRFAIALGYGGLYNHSDYPNADVLRIYEAETMEVIAVADIPAGREITIRYGWEEKELAELAAVAPSKGDK